MTATSEFETQSWPEAWQVFDHGLGKGRYTDPEFARLERDRLWYRVWQFAARLDEIPQVGDYTTYQIVDQSILIVRVAEDRVKAFFNFCPHRGTTLGEGSDTFARGAIICPFHGWRWNLEGQIQFILEREQFRDGCLEDRDARLREVHCQVFEGFVFVSLAREPQPFAEFIAPVRDILEKLKLGQMHHRWWKAVVGAPCNWKVAQEAFHETFHLAATHPQLEPVGARLVYEGIDPAGRPLGHENIAYEALAHGHGRFYARGSSPISDKTPNPTPAQLEAMIEHMEHLVEELDTMVLSRDLEVARSLRGRQVPPGSSWAAEFVKALYERAGAEGRPMPEPTPEIVQQWGGEVFVFPNLLILPNIGNAMIYRARPYGLDPDRCIFEIFSTTGYGAGEAVPRAQVEVVTDPTDPAQLPLIPRQDFSNVPRVQKGLHALACNRVWLAAEQERLILNMHRELDRYLTLP
ncbi:MAG: (2Fe-2S)-binding protein [Porticoccaceae bacterium]|nr:MAG: (2Fe-2S)-binding protein [Porticoccaceae bacterium]